MRKDRLRGVSPRFQGSGERISPVGCGAKLREVVFSYPVVRSNRKTVGITVKRGGEVIIRAPGWMRLTDIQKTVDKHRAWIEKTVKAEKALPALPDEREQEVLRKRAKETLPALVKHWAAIIGVTPTSLRITSARTRFGSCSGRNGLCFSLFLMQYPPEAIEYVVVHELCHILHHNHSAAFWACVERYLPDYRARKALLKSAT